MVSFDEYKQVIKTETTFFFLFGVGRNPHLVFFKLNPNKCVSVNSLITSLQSVAFLLQYAQHFFLHKSKRINGKKYVIAQTDKKGNKREGQQQSGKSFVTIYGVS